MAFLACTGAVLTCTMGMAPSSLAVLSVSPVATTGPVASVLDNKPFLNVLPFGMCLSPANPSVAAATVAALGVLTPMPCLPVIPAPWAPGVPTVLIGDMPALDMTSKCLCVWGGVIAIVSPGELQVDAG